MEREWFILVEGQKKGPFTVLEICKKFSIAPDTLLWKKGFPNWKKAKKIQEFAFLFEEEKRGKEKNREPKKADLVEILTLGLSPGNFFWWILLALLILLYSIFKLYSE